MSLKKRHAMAVPGMMMLAAWCGGVSESAAQTLEETVLTLERSGAESKATRQAPGSIVASDGVDWEIRVVDPVACVVRITDRAWKPFTELRSEWGDDTPTRVENTNSTHQEFYLGRVIPSVITKVPEILGTRNGVVVEQLPDAKWRLSGSPGDELRCRFWPKKPKTCWDTIEFSRLLPVSGLPNQAERTQRVDRALVHLFADLCKGADRRVPF